MKHGLNIVITLLMAITAMASDARAIRPTGRTMHLNSNDGLSNDYVKSMTQDSLGSIWIATEGGLNRFDGHSFQTYTKENSGLSSNELNSVYYDPEANVTWVSTQRDGLCFYDYATDSIYHVSTWNGLATNDIPYIAPAKDGGIWITHYHLGVQHYSLRPDETLERFTIGSVTDEQLPHPSWVAVDDFNGHLYVGHVYDGMSIIDIGTKRCRNFRHEPDNPNSLPGNEVFAICIDRNGIAWIGTNNGAASYNPSTDKFTRITHRHDNPSSLLPGMIMDIKQMDNGDIWFASSQGGVSILSMQSHAFVKPENFKFHNIISSENDQSINGTSIRSILQDSYGNVWLGSYRTGLDFISSSPSLFSNVPYKSAIHGGHHRQTVWSVCPGDGETLWIGGENEIAHQAPDGTIDIIPLINPELHPHTYAKTLLFDKKHRLWIGTDEAGAMIYTPSTGRFTTLAKVPRDVRIIEEIDGHIYIGTIDGLYSSSDGININEESRITSQLEDRTIQGLLRDKSGKLWIGTFGKGVSVFDVSDSLIYQFNVDMGFPSNAVNSMMADSKGRIWTATRNGVVVFDDTSNPEAYKTINLNDGNYTPQSRSIEEDANGNIWVSTDKNIVRLNADMEPMTVYTRYGDLRLNSFLDHSSAIGPDGTLYFGSLNGLFEFNPRLFDNLRQPPIPIISHFYALKSDGSVIDGEQELRIKNGRITLPYDHNSFAVTISTTDYSFNGEIEYSYHMEGIDNAWHNVGDDQKVVFRNLAPGTYAFRVRSRMFGTEWNNASTSLHLSIEPPLWLTWWAKAIYAAMLALLITLTAHSYKRRLKLKQSLEIERQNSKNRQLLNEERLRFYTNITHELRTPLTLILGPLEDLLSDKHLSSKHTAKIQVIHDSSMRLLNLINGILEFRKTETQNRKLSVEKANLSNLVREIGMRYKELNRNANVKYIIDIDSNDTVIYFDSDMITTILDNLLSNASKYTSDGSITLRLNSTEENGVKYTDLSVIDTGHGISHKELSHIFERYYQANSPYQASGSGIGLALVKSLAELHSATLSVESEVDKGTTFKLRLLTDNTYPDALHGGNPSSRKEGEKESEAEKHGNPDDKPILLIVEDDKDIQQYVASSLCDEFTVLTAANGREGLSITLERIPDIVVSDIMMPIMDGIALCRAIRAEISTSHVPIVLLTARDSIADKEEGYSAGADSYLTKPFSAKLLRSRLHNLLDRRTRMAKAILSATDLRVIPKPADPAAEIDHSTPNPLDTKFINKITEIIDRNAEMDKMDIAFIAGEMAMSHSTLYRKVKAVTGMSVNEFIRKVKLRKAAQALLQGNHTVSEISYMTGFSSVAYFRQCFKTEFGVSPSEYSKTNNGQPTDND